MAVAVRNKATKLYSALVNYLIFIVFIVIFFGGFFKVNFSCKFHCCCCQHIWHSGGGSGIGSGGKGGGGSNKVVECRDREVVEVIIEA